MNNTKFKEYLTKLVSVDTTNPPGNEFKLEETVKQIFKENGYSIEVLKKDTNRSNVIGTIGKGKKSLGIICHMDTVPAGEGWSTDPFSVAEVDGKYIGRGVVDDKGPFVIALMAVNEFLKTNPDQEQFQIKVYAIADEEADNEYGINFLIERGIKLDGALILDGGWMDRIDVGEKGCVQLIVTAHGVQEHSGLQEKGNHAINHLTEFLHRFVNYDWKLEYDKRFTNVVVNPSMIGGGAFPNSIPAEAHCQIDVRYPRGVIGEQVLQVVDALINEVREIRNGDIEYQVVYVTNPHYCDQSELSDSLQQAGKVYGISMTPITIAGNSVAKELNFAGIPAICHLPFIDYPAHEPNESLKIVDAEMGVKVYAEFLKNYFTLP